MTPPDRSEKLADAMAALALQPDGKVLETHSSTLAPVIWQGQPAFLKIAHNREELRGNRLMASWQCSDAAQVFATHQASVLLERATGSTLAEVAPDIDEEVERFLHASSSIHQTPPNSSWNLEPLRVRFSALLRHPDAPQARLAEKLFAGDQPKVLLHGDLHHGNILKFKDGWKTIDPKALIGTSTFEFAPFLMNPNPTLAKQRLVKRIEKLSKHAGIAPSRIAEWLWVYTELSALWSLEDGFPDDARTARAFGAQVAREFGIA